MHDNELQQLHRHDYNQTFYYIDNNIYVSQLIIENITKNYSGVYVCVARNVKGVEWRRLFIHVVDRLEQTQFTYELLNHTHKIMLIILLITFVILCIGGGKFTLYVTCFRSCHRFFFSYEQPI